MNDQSEALLTMSAVRDALARTLVGHHRLVQRLLIALVSGGHLLIEGAPGLAKTRAIKHFAGLLDTQFVRIQATPDLLPADITGTDVLDPKTGGFRFVPGPLFHHIVLVDEVNRAPPKVQSALLEAMAENQVTTGGQTRALEPPFMVAATQNPLEHEGTYPLPEAQLDRFMFMLAVNLPDTGHERRILDQVLEEQRHSEPVDTPLLAGPGMILQARHEAAHIHLSGAVRDYIVRLVMATRGVGVGATAAQSIAQPASPRGSIFLAQAARTRAWLEGRDHVTPDDVAELACDVLHGRIGLHYQARAQGVQSRQVIEQLLEATPPL